MALMEVNVNGKIIKFRSLGDSLKNLFTISDLLSVSFPRERGTTTATKRRHGGMGGMMIEDCGRGGREGKFEG